MEYWREAIISAGSLTGVAGGLLYVAAAVADPLAVEEVRREHGWETALISIMLLAPSPLALFGAAIARHRRPYGVAAVAAATLFSLTNTALAAFTVIGLVFVIATILLACGSISLLVARPAPRGGGRRET